MSNTMHNKGRAARGHKRPIEKQLYSDDDVDDARGKVAAPAPMHRGLRWAAHGSEQESQARKRRELGPL